MIKDAGVGGKINFYLLFMKKRVCSVLAVLMMSASIAMAIKARYAYESDTYSEVLLEDVEAKADWDLEYGGYRLHYSSSNGFDWINCKYGYKKSEMTAETTQNVQSSVKLSQALNMGFTREGLGVSANESLDTMVSITTQVVVKETHHSFFCYEDPEGYYSYKQDDIYLHLDQGCHKDLHLL